MPTARELLEQADALMRRNRARDRVPPAPPEAAPVVDDGVPELTEVAVAPAAAAGSAPDAVAQPLVPVPAEGKSPEALVGTVVPDEAPPAATPPEAGGPPLREALARDVASPAAVYPPSPDAPMALDDIPELTEIVEEIEAPSILDATADFEMGEPSVWMEPGHGEVSILGRWPEMPAAEADGGGDRGKTAGTADGETEVGVLHVAPDLVDAALAAALPSDDVLPRGGLSAAPTEPGVAPAAAPAVDVGFAIDDEEVPAPAERAATQDGTEAAPVEVETESAPAEDQGEAASFEDEAEVAPLEAAVEVEAALAEDQVEAATVDKEVTRVDPAASTFPSGSADFGPAARAAAAGIAESVDELDAAPAASGQAPATAVPVPDDDGAARIAAALVPPSAAAIGAAGAWPAELATPAPETDAERWDRLAEEVRMQVLQRIDIFTDTGLQEQLARRLQPMVDRASADLVATINHHVGALMRAYVAEAIEREIEKWRAGGR